MLVLHCPHASSPAQPAPTPWAQARRPRLACPLCAPPFQRAQDAARWPQTRSDIRRQPNWPWQLPRPLPDAALRISEPPGPDWSSAPGGADLALVRVCLAQGQLSFALLSTVQPGARRVQPLLIRQWVRQDAAAVQVLEQHVLISSLAQLDAWLFADPLARLDAEALLPLREACRAILQSPLH